ncbi:hypothetical protein [Xanthobacter oligotrophicus]|uniref:hypothetical protein n=1 Tax=Xanthobacter oligotrophicus TaxID=2607286 RepID=UPI0011F304DE|nr:hypothetical protein [Xanthobacter oligotrophicus]
MVDIALGTEAGRHNEKQIPGDRARPLDVHRWSDYPELNNCLNDIINELKANEQRERRRNQKAEKKFRAAIRCLTLDLYVAWKSDPSLLVAVARGKSHFGKKTRYSALYISYDQFIQAFNGLRDLGYLEIVYEGFNDRQSEVSKTTRVRATQKLINTLTDKGALTLASIRRSPPDEPHEIIILKDKNKRPIDYDDTTATTKMRNDLKMINHTLLSSWIDINLSDIEFIKLQKRISARTVDSDNDSHTVDLTRIELHRVFNNSSWDEGGRFYGGWWQTIPSEMRKFITINEKDTVELDYSGMHVKMLYAEVGEELTGDAYEIPNLVAPRPLIKRTFNKLINASGRIRIDIEFDANNIGMSWEQFIGCIIRHHHRIDKFINSGYGVKLQRMDSDIANAVMLRFHYMNYACLPIHDSFIVIKSLADELGDIMIEEFRKFINKDIDIKAKDIIEHIPSDAIDMRAALMESLGREGEYKGYYQRHLEWLTRKHREK